MILSHLTARPQIPYCHSERAQRAEESGRWAKAAGEESPSGMLLPAAGAAVAARPAIWRAALPTGRTPFVPENRHFWSQSFQQTPSVPKNPSFREQNAGSYYIRFQKLSFWGTDSAQNAF